MILSIIVHVILIMAAVGIVLTLIEWTTGKTLKAVPEEPKPETDASTLDTSAIDAYFGPCPEPKRSKQKPRKVMKWVPRSGHSCDPFVFWWSALH